jgi:acyl-CoA dehydrogenase
MKNVASKGAGLAACSRRDDDIFLGAVREFLAKSLTPELRAAARATTGFHSEISACRLWHGKLAAQGWIAPAWPREYGGTGWTPKQRFLFDRECADNDAPILFGAGIRSLGPLLIAAGSSEQKARYLPRILTGDDLWCQGFSEAGAGSDLAALRMGATGDGTHYRLTGRKLWTTGAQYSNRMFALVRTSQTEKPQRGLTFLLVDMNTPGISISPIRSIDGECDFSEVEFDDVYVPEANRVGAEGDGWKVAKLLMRFARGNNTTSAHLRRAMRRARERATFFDRVAAELDIALSAYESLELALLSANKLDGSDEGASSMLKTLATELNQRISEYGLDEAEMRAMMPEQPDARRYFATRAASIYSGTNEIHRNLMARHLLAW